MYQAGVRDGTLAGLGLSMFVSLTACKPELVCANATVAVSTRRKALRHTHVSTGGRKPRLLPMDAPRE